MVSRVSFPKGFVWGAATSSYQIEGAANEDGRGESIWDRFAHIPGNIKDGTSGDVACDHYHRFPEDVRLMKSLGLGAYRFSVAWPRIQPTGKGSANEKGLAFYDRLVDALLAAGITPFATLYHWDLPQALQDEGGWVARSTAERFTEYTDIVTRRLGDRVKNWITHNEPWCASLVSYEKGLHAPGMKHWPSALASSHHLLLSHGFAVPVIRRNVHGAEVGITVNLSPSMPASISDADRQAARHYDGYMNRWFLDPVMRAQYPADMLADYGAQGKLPRDWSSIVRPGDLAQIAAPTDFLGVNYYNRHVARSEDVPEKDNAPRRITVGPEAERTDIGWEVYAEGMFETLVRVHLEYRPAKIHITENGASYGDAPDAESRVHDGRRVRFIRDHLLAARRAVDLGVPLAGYFVWSLLDNYEWDHGYSQRFGIAWVDYATQQRILKDSALFYRDVASTNSVPTE